MSSDPTETFRQEARGQLRSSELERDLLDLEQHPDNGGLVNLHTFRALHRHRRLGAMFGFTDVAAVRPRMSRPPATACARACRRSPPELVAGLDAR